MKSMTPISPVLDLYKNGSAPVPTKLVDRRVRCSREENTLATKERLLQGWGESRRVENLLMTLFVNDISETEYCYRLHFRKR